MTSNDIWDDGLSTVSQSGDLPGTYITNPDSSFRYENASEDRPQLLYQSSERSNRSLWDDIKKNEWHYLLMYVSNF
jgi:hypothetical protein